MASRIEWKYIYMSFASSLQSLYDTIMRRKSKPLPLFYTVLQEYLTKYNSENSKLKTGTREKNDKILENIHRFLSANHLTHLKVDEVRIKHMEELKLWLHRNLGSCCLTHSARHLSFCSRALKYAVNQEYINYNVLESMEIKRDQVKEIVYLEWSEYLKLAGSQFKIDIYNHIRDLYLFQCSTGLSYGELKDYNIITDRKGREWISDGRTKNESAFRVPLFAPAKELHLKYNGRLPVKENGTYNRIIKEIAWQIGIDKHLTTHTARKTFATLRHEEGWSTRSISDMLGNSMRTCELHYIKRTHQRVENELIRLKVVQ